MDYTFNYNFGDFDTSAFVELGAAIVAVLVIVGIIALVCVVLYIIGMYKLLKKGNKHPVGAFIAPVGTFQMMELTGLNQWWLLIVAGLTVISSIPVLGLVGIAGLIYFGIIYCTGIAKSFGKEDNTGFIVGLVLLHPIFVFILGISDCNYVGPKPVKDFLFNKEGKEPTK